MIMCKYDPGLDPSRGRNSGSQVVHRLPNVQWDYQFCASGGTMDYHKIEIIFIFACRSSIMDYQISLRTTKLFNQVVLPNIRIF